MAFNPLMPGRLRLLLLTGLFLLAVQGLLLLPTTAQEGAAPSPSDLPSDPSAAVEEEPLPEAEPAAPADAGEADGVAIPIAGQRTGMNLLWLLARGGWFMVPLALLSILVVAITVERFIALRTSQVLPPQLVRQLAQIGSTSSGFDPRKAYRACQQYPSAAATVIRAMLMKIGRPHSEVEHAVGETSQRESERLYTNVRWLNLAAAVAPLLGLLGTVWGMIHAFYDTSQLAVGEDRSVALAHGIYTALVTTLCGLGIAIPAAILSHHFEGRIQKLFHEIDDLLFNLLPQVERYEGRVRFRRPGEGEHAPEASAPEPPPVTASEPAPAGSQ